MRLLLTNDDGYDCEGIQSLAKRLSRDHEVWVIAPDRNRSGVSHCISMSGALRLVTRSARAYAYEGNPVDCIIAGIRGGLLPGLPDAVLSGINKGANIGTDIVYSGTASAACQAVLYGVPGIALSIVSSNDIWQYDALADFAAKNLSQLISLCTVAQSDGAMPHARCVYVNVKASSAYSYRGVKSNTTPAFRQYKDTLQLYTAPDTQNYFFFKEGKPVSESRGNSDYEAVHEGYISISRIFAEPVNADVVDGIAFSL